MSFRSRSHDERGATAVLVALLMVPLIGFAALAVDIAAVYSERQQLQNGADAAALAIAHDCAKGLPNCSAYQVTADDLTTANYDEAGSVQGAATVDLDLAAQEVTVTNPGTQGHWFAPVLGEDSTTVSASATVQWGNPGSGTAVLPLAFSKCAFDAVTGGGAPTGDMPVTVTLPKKADDGCTGSSGNPMPGAFAWLLTDPDVCRATTDIDETVASDPGNSVPDECTNEYFQNLLGKTVLLPIYEDVSGTGAGAEYTISGYAAFTITGYDFASKYTSSPAPDCGGPGSSGRCIAGFFTEYVDSSGEFTPDPAAPDLGATTVRLIA
ncbi:Putative uncharacterized protein [Blastococcus saxobsidens DD2]|uniref:Putative Flp pilus-assembly TadG-like N-terminal domain-containing protein n=1 Tax=Blastococcus saxobsidens (strain DD2) TaxID=1146883 RepID=H6RRT9_BLASD|nr:Putative uncharacterized protein [Blastococcus saxobsidens DD2]